MSEAASSRGATTAPSLQVFLCHSSGDKVKVRELYRRLTADGFRPWLDEEDLLPGHDWQREITLAVKNSDVVIVCLSQASVTKAGYVQREIKVALDVADEQPEGTIFLIPLRLEECEVPQRLCRWQWVNLFEPSGYEKLVRALEVRGGSAPEHPASYITGDTEELVALEPPLLRLKLRTALLYDAIVDCVRNATLTGSAEIRNSTLRSIKADLEDLTARGLLTYYLASQDLSVETTNRVDFKVVNISILEAAVDRIERLSPSVRQE
jgi:hypothetical protein